MTVSSKPQYDDQLIEVRENELGEKFYGGSSLFLRWIDDISDNGNFSFSVLNTVKNETFQAKADLAASLAQIRKDIAAINSGSVSIDELKQADAMLSQAVSKIDKTLKSLESEAAEMNAVIKMLLVTIDQQDKRLNKLEQVAWP